MPLTDTPRPQPPNASTLPCVVSLARQCEPNLSIRPPPRAGHESRRTVRKRRARLAPAGEGLNKCIQAQTNSLKISGDALKNGLG